MVDNANSFCLVSNRLTTNQSAKNERGKKMTRKNITSCFQCKQSEKIKMHTPEQCMSASPKNANNAKQTFLLTACGEVTEICRPLVAENQNRLPSAVYLMFPTESGLSPLPPHHQASVSVCVTQPFVTIAWQLAKEYALTSGCMRRAGGDIISSASVSHRRAIFPFQSSHPVLPTSGTSSLSLPPVI